MARRANGLYISITFPRGVDEEFVKKCALKEMAQIFSTFKKKLLGKFIKRDKEPDWNKLPQVKDWEEFKQYKLSEEAQELSEKNKINAAAKKYNHHLRRMGIGRRLRNGRRWSRNSWIEVSGRRLGTGRKDQSGSCLLMVSH